jgi:hypothetical protein
MTPKQKKAVDEYLKTHRVEGEDLVHNGFHSITPLQLIDTLATAKDALDYSNYYDCGNLDRILTYLLMYCEEHNIPLGEHVPETFESSLNLHKYE